jgi:hypothetical protein
MKIPPGCKHREGLLLLNLYNKNEAELTFVSALYLLQ